MHPKHFRILGFLLIIGTLGWSQSPLVEEWRSPSVQGIKINRKGNPLSFPIANLGEPEAIELNFDDLNSSAKPYYYSLVLCNADWTPANLSTLDFIRGFSQVRISQYRFSSATQTRYVHYAALIPAANSMPTRSGNYLLKVFENADTSKLLFSKRILLVDQKASVVARILQPFSQAYFLTHQKVTVDVAPLGFAISNPIQELKVVAMQNNQWNTARMMLKPSFIRGTGYEYNDEEHFVFEAGKEWRWLDLRSLRLQSDRIGFIDYNAVPNKVLIRPDTVRSAIRYYYYNDLNGQFEFRTLENRNPFWQGEYAQVNFTFLPVDGGLSNTHNFYLYAEFTGYQLTDKTRLNWNETLQAYEKEWFLKNGFYNYSYVAVPKNKPNDRPSFQLTEGNRWETENQYRVLVYYRPFGARSDQLIGVTESNSLQILNTNR